MTPEELRALEIRVDTERGLVRVWRFVEAANVEDFKQATKLSGALYDQTGAKMSVIGSDAGERIATLLNGDQVPVSALLEWLDESETISKEFYGPGSEILGARLGVASWIRAKIAARQAPTP